MMILSNENKKKTVNDIKSTENALMRLNFMERINFIAF